MDLPLSLVLPLLGVLLLTVLVTGPGMWSEEWGWWWVKRRRPGRVREDGGGEEPEPPGTGTQAVTAPDRRPR